MYACRKELYILFLTPLQQTAFKNIVKKGEIAQNKQVLLLPQYFQLYSIILLLFIDIFTYFLDDVFNGVCSEWLYVGKGSKSGYKHDYGHIRCTLSISSL